MCRDHIPAYRGGKRMILEEETYEKFGYYPRDLKPYSTKLILAACDECEKIRIYGKRDYHSLCKSCVKKGARHPLWGKHHSEKTKQKICGENNPRWKGGKVKRMCEGCGTVFEVDPAVVRYGNGKFCSHSCTIKATRHKWHPKKSNPESIFEQICKKDNLPFKYTGDGAFWIGEKGEKHLNPDFIEVNGKKILVEIFGDYWHSPLLNLKLKEDRTLSYQKRHYKRYKWYPIFLWESDLKRKDAEQFVLNELQKHKNM